MEQNDQRSGARKERRIALVIGNSAYLAASPLKNPSNDARDVSSALQRLGFSGVALDLQNGSLSEDEPLNPLFDLDADQLRKALAAFVRSVDETTDMAVLYYAGHGVEVAGKNYLIPINAKLQHAKDVGWEAASLDDIIEGLDEGSGLRLIILDACRDNPFRSRMISTRALSRGLARVEPPSKDILVAYSSKHGKIALDGFDGREGNSPYASALLRYIELPGLEIAKLFREVRAYVAEITSSRQEPYTYGQLGRREYYFVPPTPRVKDQPRTVPEGDQIRPVDDPLSKVSDPKTINTFLEVRKQGDGNAPNSSSAIPALTEDHIADASKQAKSQPTSDPLEVITNTKDNAESLDILVQKDSSASLTAPSAGSQIVNVLEGEENRAIGGGVEVIDQKGSGELVELPDRKTPIQRWLIVVGLVGALVTLAVIARGPGAGNQPSQESSRTVQDAAPTPAPAQTKQSPAPPQTKQSLLHGQTKIDPISSNILTPGMATTAKTISGVTLRKAAFSKVIEGFSPNLYRLPDGKHALSCTSTEAGLRLVSLAKGAEADRSLLNADCRTVVLAAQGKLAFVQTQQGNAFRIDLASGTVSEIGDNINGFAASLDGQWVAISCAGDGPFCNGVFKLENEEKLEGINFANLCFRPDGKGYAYIPQGDSRKISSKGGLDVSFEREISHFSYTPDSRYLVVIEKGDDNIPYTLTVLQADGTRIARANSKQRETGSNVYIPSELSFSDDSKYLVVAEDGADLNIYAIPSLKKAATLRGPTGGTYSGWAYFGDRAVFSPDNAWIFAASANELFGWMLTP
jgi:Caspase domain